ncbi:MAG: pentapeptide repeat-containing protein [Prevotella sp.]|jgi:uncharacterized protein YjbI with pentapeptide repeats|nr:pentapeptide repeat-containing protein [Prevotella sp.]
MAIYEDKTFEGVSYTDGLHNETFEYCIFSNCNFSDAKVLSCNFMDCTFINCNLSMTVLTQSAMNNANFINCKMLGVKFNNCHDFIFQVAFDGCILDYSSFGKRKMSKTIFKNSSIKGTDFGEADLKQSKFINSDLSEAIFYNTNIQEADFTSAYNYSIDLSQNNIKKARFSKDGLAGLLHPFDIIIEG